MQNTQLILNGLMLSTLQTLQDNFEDPHKPPPSPVVHVRGLNSNVLEADLVEAVQHFGPIR